MKILAFLIILVCLVVMVTTLNGSGKRKRKAQKSRDKHRTFDESINYSATKSSEQLEPVPSIQPVENDSFPKHKRSKYLATENERRFHDALKQAIPSEYNIHCQVSLMALVQPLEWKDNSRTWAKRMDFVITDSDTQVLAVIELDDYTHNWAKRKKRDEYVNTVLEGHHNLVRFKSSKHYDPLHIRQELDLISSLVPDDPLT
ncbi:DUF2726 domain-containing protein [Vibrio galatheae]|nr:DUF2726 domain-containing protein [Vibrio galatheae]